MHIAIFEPNFFTNRPNASSYLVVLQQQVEYLARRGHTVSVITQTKNQRDLKERGCRVYEIGGLFQYITSKFSSEKKSVPFFSDIFSIDSLYSAARRIKNEIQPDVLYTCGSAFASINAAFLGKLSGVPTLHYIFTPLTEPKWWRAEIDSFHGYSVSKVYFLKQIVLDGVRMLFRRRWFLRWGLSNVSLIVTCAETIKEDIVRYFPDIDSEKISVVHPGVEPPDLDTAVSLATTQITYFGHLWQGRGVLDLVEAFAVLAERYPHTRLLLASSNIHHVTEFHLKKLIEKYALGSRVIMRGIVPNIYDEVLSKSSVVVLPYRDSPSIKLIESMAAGKAVVTTDIGWSAEVIHDGENGCLVEAGNSKALAEKISLLLDSPQIMSTIGSNARKTIEEMYSMKVNVDSLERVLSKIILGKE